LCGIPLSILLKLTVICAPAGTVILLMLKAKFCADRLKVVVAPPGEVEGEAVAVGEAVEVGDALAVAVGIAVAVAVGVAVAVAEGLAVSVGLAVEVGVPDGEAISGITVIKVDQTTGGFSAV
jgi:hypothetical protein